MLFLALVLVIILYAGLFMFWEAAQPHLGGATSWLTTLNRMVFAPDEVIFVILRGLILITVFYIVADFALSTAKRQLKRRSEPRTTKNTWHAKRGPTP